MSELNQGELEKYIINETEKSRKDLSARHESALRAVQEYGHPLEHVENKCNEIVSVLQEHGLSADVKIIQDFVLRFKATMQSLWRKKGQEVMRDAQEIVDSAMRDGKVKDAYNSEGKNKGIPIAFQFNDDDGNTYGRFFDSYHGQEFTRADIPETQSLIKFELESKDPDIKREFIKCRLSKEAERILHKILGTLDKTGNFYDAFNAKRIPSILNSAVQKCGFNYEQAIPSIKGCSLVVKKEYSSERSGADIRGVEITIYPDKLFLARAMEEFQEHEGKDKIKQPSS
ncbi:MAG: hypothetical protein AAB666_00225 [Patescibacteria group bacterium]